MPDELAWGAGGDPAAEGQQRPGLQQPALPQRPVPAGADTGVPGSCWLLSGWCRPVHAWRGNMLGTWSINSMLAGSGRSLCAAPGCAGDVPCRVGTSCMRDGCLLVQSPTSRGFTGSAGLHNVGRLGRAQRVQAGGGSSM